jgi:flavin-dependent thymidylate synthase
MTREYILNGQGYVELLYTIPSDTQEFKTKDFFIAQAAAHSTQATIDTDEKVKELIHKLFGWGHFSPFEQAVLSLEIKAPVVVWWQLDRHRTFKYGSHLRRSGRYTDYTDIQDFYIPEYFEDIYVEFFDGEGRVTEREKAEVLYSKIEESIYLYKQLLDNGAKKESARFVLPAWCMMYTEVMNVDLKNLLHMLSLRMDESAQIEIRELANAVYRIVKEEFPYTIEAFDSGRPAVNYL